MQGSWRQSVAPSGCPSQQRHGSHWTERHRLTRVLRGAVWLRKRIKKDMIVHTFINYTSHLDGQEKTAPTNFINCRIRWRFWIHCQAQKVISCVCRLAQVDPSATQFYLTWGQDRWHAYRFNNALCQSSSTPAASFPVDDILFRSGTVPIAKRTWNPNPFSARHSNTEIYFQLSLTNKEAEVSYWQSQKHCRYTCKNCRDTEYNSNWKITTSSFWLYQKGRYCDRQCHPFASKTIYGATLILKSFSTATQIWPRCLYAYQDYSHEMLIEPSWEKCLDIKHLPKVRNCFEARSSP